MNSSVDSLPGFAVEIRMICYEDFFDSGLDFKTIFFVLFCVFQFLDKVKSYFFHFRSQYVPPIYPPILANVCLTRLKPFKDAAHARTESERIGNNYSKYAKDLKLTHKKSSTRRNASLRQVFNLTLKIRPLIGQQS